MYSECHKTYIDVISMRFYCKIFKRAFSKNRKEYRDYASCSIII